jgi:hypothetical protein
MAFGLPVFSVYPLNNLSKLEFQYVRNSILPKLNWTIITLNDEELIAETIRAFILGMKDHNQLPIC